MKEKKVKNYIENNRNKAKLLENMIINKNFKIILMTLMD